MHIAISISLATILTIAAVVWFIFAMLRARYRRKRLLRQQAKEAARLERREKVIQRIDAIKGLVRRR